MGIQDALNAAKAKLTQAEATSDAYLAGGPGFKQKLEDRLMEKAAYFAPFEEAKNKALAAHRYAQDTDVADTQGMSFGARNAVTAQRAQDQLGKFYTNQDIIENIRGQMGGMVGDALSAYTTEAELADRKTGRAGAGYNDLLQRSLMPDTSGAGDFGIEVPDEEAPQAGGGLLRFLRGGTAQGAALPLIQGVLQGDPRYTGIAKRAVKGAFEPHGGQRAARGGALGMTGQTFLPKKTQNMIAGGKRLPSASVQQKGAAMGRAPAMLINQLLGTE